MTQELLHVRMYMRSGNVIDLKDLKKFSYKKMGSEFSELNWEFADGPGEALMSVNLSQIDAITQIFKE